MLIVIIPTIVYRRVDTDIYFIYSLLNDTVDAPDLLASISLLDSTYSTNNHSLFISYHTTPCMATINPYIEV